DHEVLALIPSLRVCVRPGVRRPICGCGGEGHRADHCLSHARDLRAGGAALARCSALHGRRSCAVLVRLDWHGRAWGVCDQYCCSVPAPAMGAQSFITVAVAGALVRNDCMRISHNTLVSTLDGQPRMLSESPASP